MITPPNDPLFRYQWFLSNTGQSGGGIGSDINVLPVWPDYTGRGVRVAIVDDGVQLDHPDLAANIDLAGSWDAVTNTPGGGPSGGANHGTPVAGLVAEIANNGIGGSGVAPEATLLAYRINLSDGKGGTFATIAFQKALENRADVVSNSWGGDDAFDENRNNPDSAAFYASLDALASQGRGGKGSIILFANGNQGARNFDGNLDNVLNDRHVIAVAAVDDNGQRSAYSTPGANLLVAAPAGASTGQAEDRPGSGVLSTDRTGTDGYNRLAGTAGDWAYNFNGTSAATPVASGVVALVLQANPNLGYRDVQEILALSARFVDTGATSWTSTHTASPWNGGGALFSRDYGFGQVDAHGAVRLAEVYPYLHSAPRSDANVVQRTASVPVNIQIDSDPQPSESDDFPSLENNVTVAVSLPSGVDLEHLDLTLFADLADSSNLTVTLRSPTGTVIRMIDSPANAAAAWPTDGFAMGTNAFWGEQSGGTWLIDVAIGGEQQVGTVQSITLTGYGEATTTEREFVYTDSLGAAISRDTWIQGSASRTTLTVAAGETAVINAAAVSGSVSVDLSPLVRQAVIAGTAINIDAGARVTKVFTGDGNDSLIGDAGDNALLAGRGLNTLDGAAGIDTALYIGSRAAYTVTYTSTGVFTSSTLTGNSKDTAVRIEKASFTEGTLFVQAASDAGLDIAAYYQGLLFRPIDANGYRYWTDAASQGVNVSSIGSAFQGSAEYAATAGKLSDSAYVDAVYQQMLDRPADAAGAVYWTQQLASGAQTRAGMVVAIEQSTEYAATQLVGTFQEINNLGNLWT